MRQAIIDYRLRRQSMRSMVDALETSFGAGSARLQEARERCLEDLHFLDAIAEAGGDESPKVLEAIDAVESARANRPPRRILDGRLVTHHRKSPILRRSPSHLCCSPLGPP